MYKRYLPSANTLKKLTNGALLLIGFCGYYQYTNKIITDLRNEIKSLKFRLEIHDILEIMKK